MKTQLGTHIRDSWTDVHDDENAENALLFISSPSEIDPYIVERVEALKANGKIGLQFLDQIGRQRFRVQKDFVDFELDNTTASKKFTHNGYHLVFIVSLILAPIFTLLAAAAIWIDSPVLAGALVTLSAISTAMSLASRVLETGLGYGKDIKRYSRYLENIRATTNIYSEARGSNLEDIDFKAMLYAWVSLEKHSYLEMREFFHNHKDDHFFN